MLKTGLTEQTYSTDSGLAGQTIYTPSTTPSGLKLPVIVWGVGGCSDSGTNTAEFHQDLASYGFLVIVNNGPTARTQTQATSLTTAANWAEKAAGTGKYANVDKTRIAVGGWSCGGLQAYTVTNDPRWATIGIFSSGQLDASQSVPVVSKITKPIFYFLGGNGDPAQTPVFLSLFFFFPFLSFPFAFFFCFSFFPSHRFPFYFYT